MNLAPVTILLKTLLRDPYLFDSIKAIRNTMPEVTILVIDDGDNHHAPAKKAYAEELRRAGSFYYFMPFDSGFGAKSNMAVWHMNQPEFTTEYLLIGSDDFDFKASDCRPGIEKMFTVLEHDRSVSIASGWVNSYDYDFHIEEQAPDEFEEVRLTTRPTPVQLAPGGVKYQQCDLTVNYSMIRASILGFGEQQVHWDSDVKIGGGEHGAFFLDVKRAGHKVVHVHDVHIREQNFRPACDMSRYGPLRRRACKPERPCFVKRGVRRWGSDWKANG